jgi:hypothetical protein
VKFNHRGHREHREEIRNTKHEIRNKSEFLMLKCSKRKGIADYADSRGLNSQEATKGTREKEGGIGVSGEQEVGIRAPGDRRQKTEVENGGDGWE